MQLALYELHAAEDMEDKRIVRDVRLHATESVARAAGAMHDYLGIDPGMPRTWSSHDEALGRWREAVQDCGVFVFKRSCSDRSVSGFCLQDDLFPVIYLNSSTPKTRQIFSLFHELAHLLLGANGITKEDDSYILHLPSHPRRIEVFCNRLAAEFLVPVQEFLRQFRGADFLDDTVVEKAAKRYHVSREMILRRALDAQGVSQRHYERKAEQWAAQARQGPKGTSHPTYYTTQTAYLGSKFIELAFRRYYQGRCTREDLADYLNVKVKNLAGLEPLGIHRRSRA